jgi:hydrogenase maturation protease
MRIICCGTPYRSDDSVGLVVAERLHRLGVEAATCTGEVTDLLQAMESAEEVLVVDAVITGAPAGTIHEWTDGTTEFQRNSSTTHALGVAEAISLARALGRLPARTHIYSIEAKTFEVGGELSAEVRRAAGELVHRIADLVSAPAPGIPKLAKASKCLDRARSA